MAAPYDEAAWSEEAARRVWGGAVPLQVHLHDADVTALPPPPPFLTLGPRIGYLPLLVPIIKAHFSSALPPGVDTVWFEYNGLPLKWYVPIGVLFDLLCADPERPWNLTVHFRRYPAEILSPCDGEDNVKWSYINALKEAAFIITGNNKNVMNMSQADQVALWESVMKGNLDGYMNISTRLKLGPFEEDCLVRTSSVESQQSSDEPESPGSGKPCRVPVRLYVRSVQEDLEDLRNRQSPSPRSQISPSAMGTVVDAPAVVAEKEEATDDMLGDKKVTVVFVLGGPGSGKGTQCANIVEHFGFTHLSAGDLLRAEIKSGSENGTMIENMIKEGKIVPSEVTIKLLQEAMIKSGNDKFLIDGFPRNEENRAAFENVTKISPAFVLFFDCSEEEMEKRLLGRNQGRVDDNIETIRKRFKVFVESSLPVIEYYNVKAKIKKIDAAKPIPEVFEDVKTIFAPYAPKAA